MNNELLQNLYSIPLNITIEAGRTTLLLKNLLEIAEGSLIELDTLKTDDFKMYVNGKLIASCDIVCVDDKLGIQIKEIF